MIILDKPYVSDFLIDTIRQNNYPILQNAYARQLNLDADFVLWEAGHAVKQFEKNPMLPLYAPSENSLQWVADHFAFTNLPKMITVFKDKPSFRKMLAGMYPDFYFREILFDELDDVDIDDAPEPLILKPAAGFFSIGVHKVNSKLEWRKAVHQIKLEAANFSKMYPTKVLDASRFIIEENIAGTEFAFDAYFNQHGEPILLNIFEHVFASDNDVSDRVYITSKEIIQNHLHKFTRFLHDVAQLAPVANFPVHVEVRVGEDGVIRPIEINPLRFGGWCTTADATFHAFQFNPYEYFIEQKIPDWSLILQNKEGLNSIIVLDNSTGFDGKDIGSFNYDKLLGKFEKPLELRKVNFREYPVFGFLFVETRAENFVELETILKSDLTEFIKKA